MKQVDVKDQVRLSLGKSFELVVSGIKYRLFRSSVTVATIALAVAFLMTMLGQSVVRRSVRSAVHQQTAPRRSYEQWLARLGKPLTHVELHNLLIGQSEDAHDRPAELKLWGQLSEEEYRRLADLAAQEQQYLEYFQSLDEGDQSILLLGDSDRGSEIFRSLAGPERFGVFTTEADRLPKRMPAALRAELEAFVLRWNQAAPLRQRVLDGHAKAVEALAKDMGSARRMAESLAEADEQTRQTIERHGFILPPERLNLLAEQARLSVTMEQMLRWQGLSEVRALLAKQASIALSKVSDKTLLNEANTRSKADTLRLVVLKAKKLNRPDEELTADQQAEKAALVALDPELLADAAKARIRQDRLAQVEGGLEAEDTEGFLGFSRRTMWLIIVSFGVCAVGIANAMLMSVTERFREIATMKCLGAMDGFIMLEFVLESCLQGMAGGLIGASVGALLGLIRAWIEFGGLAFTQMPGWTLLGCAGTSLISGIFLAAMAAVYPAYAASRMAPMEAMRVE